MSFKFLYTGQNIEKVNLEEYFKELNKFDNEEMLINSGLEANLELADHLFKEIEYLNTVDAGLEDSEDDEKKKSVGFITMVKIIIRLVKVLLKVIGIAGINVFKLIMGKVNAYVSTAKKLTTKIVNYMEDNNINEFECKYKINRNDIRMSKNYLIDAALVIAGDYKKGLRSAIEEYMFMDKYTHYVEQISKLVKTFNVSKDMEKIDEIISKEGKITEEIIKIVKYYAVDAYSVFTRKPVSPFFDRYVLDNLGKFKIKSFFFKKDKIEKHEIATFYMEGFEEKNKSDNVSGSLVTNFLVYLEEKEKELLNLVGKTEKEIPFISDVFVFATGKAEIEGKLPEPESFTISEITKLISKIETNVEVAEKFSSELKKMYKEISSFEKEISKIEVKKIGKSKISKLVLYYIRNNLHAYIKASRFIIRYIGENIGMSIPNNVLTEITFGKGICVGYIDPGEIKNALETEVEKIKKEHDKE